MSTQPHKPGFDLLHDGLLGLIRSPLFLLASLFVAAATYAYWRSGGQLPAALLWGLGMQVLATVIIWQYLVLAKRLEGLDHFVREAREIALELRNPHRYTHRLLGNLERAQASQFDDARQELGGLIREVQQGMSREVGNLRSEALGEFVLVRKGNQVLERSLQGSIRSLGEAVNTLGEGSDKAIQVLQAGTDAQLAALGEIKAQSFDEFEQLRATLRESAHAIVADTTDVFATQLEAESTRQQLEALAGQLEKVEQAVAELNGQVTATETELARLGEASRALGTSPALQVSTALDRLNLEVRKQIAALRRALDGA